MTGLSEREWSDVLASLPENLDETAEGWELSLVRRTVERIVAARLASVEEARHATADWGRSYNAPRTGIGGPASQRLPDPRDEALARVEALADEWERESRRIRAAPVHFRGLAEEAEARAKQLRAVLGSDAHTEQKGTGE